jgi:hypothetical protein
MVITFGVPAAPAETNSNPSSLNRPIVSEK